MALKIYNFKDTVAVNLYLSGGITGGVPLSSAGVPDLVGRTIAFTVPSFSHTFVAPVVPGAGGQLTFQQIKAQLEAANANILVLAYDGLFVFVEKVPTTGCVLAATQPVTNQLFGFSSAGATGHVVNEPNGAPPSLAWWNILPSGGHAIMIQE